MLPNPTISRFDRLYSPAPCTRQEAGFNKQEQAIKGATYVVTGDVSEFGRKVVGDRQFFGVLGRGKEQVAYAKVSLNIVRVQTSEVVYSVLAPLIACSCRLKPASWRVSDMLSRSSTLKREAPFTVPLG